MQATNYKLKRRAFMICPYCNKDLRKGYISNYRCNLIWTPEEKVNLPIRFIIRKQEVVLSKYTEATAYYCEECKKCIIDIDN